MSVGFIRFIRFLSALDWVLVCSGGREWVSLWNLSGRGGVCPDIFCSFVAKVEFL